jgi:hypothetical protein
VGAPGRADLGRGMAVSELAREVLQLEQEVRALERRCGNLRATICAAAWAADAGAEEGDAPRCARWPVAGVDAGDGAGVLGFVSGGVTGLVASVVLALLLR